MVFFLIGSFYFTFRSQAVSIYDSPLHSLLFLKVYPKVQYLAHYSSLPVQLLAWWSQQIPSWWHPALHFFHSHKFCSISGISHHYFHWHRLLSWMNLNKFLLNPSKTELLFIGTKQCLKFSDFTNLSLCNDTILVSSFAQNLHPWLWSNQLCIQILSFSYPRHSSNSSSFSSVQHLQIHLSPANVTTAIHYIWHLNKLQCIQNSLACIINNTSKFQHITPTLQKLHWLSIKQRIKSQTLSFHIQNTNKSTTYISLQ